MTNITLTISNGEHIKQTLSTNRPYHHQQHLPKISQNVSEAVPVETGISTLQSTYLME